MGACLTEFIIETVLRDGLGELKLNLSRLDDIFSKFKNAYFNNQYGQAKIDSLKTYIQNNQIRIVHSMSLVPTSMPCISIQVMNSSEDEDIQEFSNLLPEVDTTIAPAIIVPVITPGTYNSTTGKLTITNSPDLSSICPGLVYVDASNVEFPINSGISNVSGNKFINLGLGKEPDLSGDGKIVSPINFTRKDRRMIRLRESVNIGCHAKDDLHMSKFIHIIVTYILKSRQLSLEDRGIALDRGISSSFSREDEFEGENVYSRYIELNCLTEFDWDQQDVNLVDCFDLTVKAPMPEPTSATAQKINTSPDE